MRADLFCCQCCYIKVANTIATLGCYLRASWYGQADNTDHLLPLTAASVTILGAESSLKLQWEMLQLPTTLWNLTAWSLYENQFMWKRNILSSLILGPLGFGTNISKLSSFVVSSSSHFFRFGCFGCWWWWCFFFQSCQSWTCQDISSVSSVFCKLLFPWNTFLQNT